LISFKLDWIGSFLRIKAKIEWSDFSFVKSYYIKHCIFIHDSWWHFWYT